VAAAFAAAVELGGVDILVSNAGISSSAPIEETTVALWDRNMDILAKGYFLVAREAFRLFKRQKIGGNIVFVASKNGLAASPNAAAYCTAKAAEIHLARCLALEGAADQIASTL
jgi:NAD(P)-dependent dehydrogenase (short-subunit alcohol dehydrogenase family)